MRRRSRQTVLWTTGSFLVGLIAINAVVDARYPVVYDPEFSVRLDALRALQADSRERPLLAVVGSSRVTLGFAPETLPPLQTPEGELVLPFNLGHIGAGPIFQGILVRRMLAAGFHPRWLVIELMPALVGREDYGYIFRFAAAPDLGGLAPVVGKARTIQQYVYRRMKDSARFPRRLALGWLPQIQEDIMFTRVLPLGGSPLLEDTVDDVTRRRRTDGTLALFGAALSGLPSPPRGDRALRDLLELCRHEGIRVALLLTPEGSVYRSRYDSVRLACFEEYCVALERSYGCWRMDARDWLDDADFYDYHHTLRRGAEKFSRLLFDRLLVPLVQAK